MILRGNALTLPLADDTVDLVVTSPPYFGLRSYQDGGQHYAGQIGDEATPAEFVDALVAATAEMVRVVKPSGSIFVNLGDKYQNQGGRNGHTSLAGVGKFAGSQPVRRYATTVPQKSLLGIPWRYALRCIDDLGLILRAEVIWAKPNGLPESVTDRVRRSHEVWFHFTRSPRYYSAVDDIREEHSSFAGFRGHAKVYGKAQRQDDGRNNIENADPTLGKLPGSVWTIPTEPLHVPEHVGVDHFAAFPTEFPRRIIQGWSPRGICVECGEGRRPVVVKELEHVNFTSHAKTRRGQDLSHAVQNVRTGSANNVSRESARITGEACACPEPTATTRPGVVLDPFGGTGTVALVAEALGRRAVHVDMSSDYCRLAQWRTTDPKQRAKAARREYKPPAEQTDGQLDLLEGIA